MNPSVHHAFLTKRGSARNPPHFRVLIYPISREQFDGGSTGRREVEFTDPPKTTGGESARRELARRPRSKAGVWTTIRDRFTSCHKLCWLAPRAPVLRPAASAGPRRKHSLRVSWRVCPQEWNLKELTETHTWTGRYGLILFNTGKLTRAKVRVNRAWKARGDRAKGCAWPPEADEVISRLIPRIGETRSSISWRFGAQYGGTARVNAREVGQR